MMLQPMNGRMEVLLEDKNAVIYRGGSAIGGSVAHACTRERARVILAGRTVALLDAVAEDISAAGGVVETARVDALDEQAIEKHADAVAEKAGCIAISFNAVGWETFRGHRSPRWRFKTSHFWS
jgi:short-subunit dehydrogenase